MPAVTLKQQMRCVRRELAMRKRVYPKWVLSERMSQDQATLEIDTMAAVLATLERLSEQGQTRLFTEDLDN